MKTAACFASTSVPVCLVTCSRVYYCLRCRIRFLFNLRWGIRETTRGERERDREVKWKFDVLILAFNLKTEAVPNISDAMPLLFIYTMQLHLSASPDILYSLFSACRWIRNGARERERERVFHALERGSSF